MDIPSLYENALLASGKWDHKSVVTFHTTDSPPPKTHALTYPYDALDGISAKAVPTGKRRRKFNTSSFRQKFKQATGMTPSQLRN